MPNIDRLFKIGLKPYRLIIGLMSGTSLDGLDVALCKCTGSGTSIKMDVLQFETVDYTDDYRQEIRAVFSRREADLQKICLLNGWVAQQHAAIVNSCLQKWQCDPNKIDLIASHGQTIYHAPRYLHGLDKFSNATLQIGDGDHLAVNTGIITISDFRQKHIAAGGEGAPLAAYGDFLLFSKEGENRVLLNIGGIANFTYLPADLDGSKVFSTDTGPGNTLMDTYIQHHFTGRYFDEQAKIAAKGKIHDSLLYQLKQHGFFRANFPKTTGPELFDLSYVENAKRAAGITLINDEDTMATLNRFSAETIADAIKTRCTGLQDIVVYTSGGGMHNPLLMKNIQAQLPGYIFKTTGNLNVNPNAKEAVLFALLANETVAGGKTRIGKDNTAMPFINMGKISFPD